MSGIIQTQNVALPNSFQQVINRPAVHVYSTDSGYAQTYFYVPCNYPVKEIIIKSNYSVVLDGAGISYAISDCPAFADGQVVTGFNGQLTVNAANYIYSGSFADGYVRYILRQPMLLQGNWSWTLLSRGANVVSYDIMLDFEFLG